MTHPSAMDEERQAAAVQLHVLGYLPWALRYSTREHGIENAMLLRHLWRPGATLTEPWVTLKLVDLLAGFDKRCTLEVITGQIGGIVAISAWTKDTQAWMTDHLPDTEAFLFTPFEDFLIYRAPGTPLESRYAPIDRDAPGRQVLRISAERASIPVAEMAYEQIFEWPPLEHLRVFDPAWLPGCPS